MAESRLSAAGGFAAIRHVLSQARASGNSRELVSRLRSANTCKSCALGMGGDLGGMVNEAGHFPEVCKKSVQAQVGDMRPAISEEVFATNDIDQLSAMTSREVDQLGRLAFPVALFPGERHFQRVSWEQALTLARNAFAAAEPDRTFFYMSGRSSNEAAFLTQLVARAYGTANIHNCSFYCHNASSVALAKVYGSGTSSVELSDLARTDLAVVVGANPASNHPRLITQLIKLRERGGKVIIINPMSELGLRRFRLPSDVRSLTRGSTVNDLYLQPRVGGDVHLLSALLKRIVELGAIDTSFVESHTSGWGSVMTSLDEMTWAELLAGSGVPRSQIDAAADLISQAPNAIFMWAMGLTHHAHGTDNILATANLALARGFLGRPGSGLLPIRGHSNVQGVGSMGVAPQAKEEFARRLAQRYAVEVSAQPGQDTHASMDAAAHGRIDAAVLLGGNLWGSNPDSSWAASAMQRIGLTFSMTTQLNPGHFHGRGKTAVIVPVLARDEETQESTQESMFNFVRYSRGGQLPPNGELRSEVDVVASLAERILPAGRFDWSELRSHASLRDAIAATVPGYEPLVTRADNTPTTPRSARRGNRDGREFAVTGRVLHDTAFATPDGRAHFHSVPLPSERLRDGELMMMTLRSEGQFNTVVYDEEDLYRGNTRRDVIMIGQREALARNLVEGDLVRVSSAVGSLEASVAVVDLSPRSAAMYYPEANVLVPQILDQASKTPAFKSVPVSIEKL